MLETDKRKGIIDKKVKGTIKIKNLSFELNNKNILNHINLTLKEGDKIMIIGKSGSGKSTLFKILMKYYEINRNQILINKFKGIVTMLNCIILGQIFNYVLYQKYSLNVILYT